MKTISLISCFAILLSSTISYAQFETRTIKSPDNKIIVKIISTGKSEDAGSESKIKIITTDGKLLKTKSYFSEDHSHGLYINQAKWTSDSKYFVFNTTLSGGHQPGHIPTFFWIKGINKIERLDPYVGIWVLSDFKLSEPDSITITVSHKMSNGIINWNLIKTISLNDLVKK